MTGPLFTQRELVADIDAKQEALATAREAYHRGGSVDAVNRATDELTQARAMLQSWQGGRVPCDRDGT
jgi:hypothetical protein